MLIKKFRCESTKFLRQWQADCYLFSFISRLYPQKCNVSHDVCIKIHLLTKIKPASIHQKINKSRKKRVPRVAFSISQTSYIIKKIKKNNTK